MPNKKTLKGEGIYFGSGFQSTVYHSRAGVVAIIGRYLRGNTESQAEESQGYITFKVYSQQPTSSR